MNHQENNFLEEEKNQEGYIYIIFNEMYNYYGENIYKIGKASNIDTRVSNYTTSYIEPVEIKFTSNKVKNYTLAEQEVFILLKEQRIKQRREFFKIVLSEAIETINIVIDKVNLMTDEEINIKLQKIKSDRIKEQTKIYNKKVIEIEENETTNDIKEIFKIDDVNIINSILNFLELFKIKTDNNKIMLLKEFEINNKIDRMDINFNNSKPEINITDDNFNLIKSFFNTKKTKPKTEKDIKELYIMMIKNIIGSYLKIIESEQIQEKNKRFYEYNLNDELFNKFKKLIQRQNKNIFDEKLLIKYDIEFKLNI